MITERELKFSLLTVPLSGIAVSIVIIFLGAYVLDSWDRVKNFIIAIPVGVIATYIRYWWVRRRAMRSGSLVDEDEAY